MPNDDDDVSSLEEHFVERSDDGETLWEVEQIVGERGNKYRVRWVGVDEKGKPWPLDWVPKSDCTDPLVRTWKRTKAEKAKRKGSRKQNVASRASTASTSTKISAASSATVNNTPVFQSRRTKPASTIAGSKRKNDERVGKPASNATLESGSDITTEGRPKKKRKLTVELSSPRVPSTSKFRVEDFKKPEAPTKPTKPRLRKPPPKPEVVYSESGSDDEIPSAVRRKHVPTTVLSPRKTVVSNASTFSRNLKRPAREEESEPDVPTARVPPKKENSVSKKARPIESTIKRSSTSKPQPASTKAAITRSPSTSSQSSKSRSPSPARSTVQTASPSPRVVSSKPQLRAEPLFLPASSHSQSGAQASEKGDQASENVDLAVNGTSQSQSGEDSALEYADLPPYPPSTPPPPPAQRKPSLLIHSPSFSSQSPPVPSPIASKGKSSTNETEIVPETEGEESQGSQRRGEEELVRSPAKKENSIISRMKPRTPGSKRNRPDADIIALPLPFNDSARSDSPPLRAKKSLRPIPRMSPSKFANLPSSTIESVETRAEGGGDESSIEQYDSPDKSSRKQAKKVTSSQEETAESDTSSLPVPPAATDVINKGIALANSAKRGKVNGIFTQAKIPLASIMENQRAKSAPSDVRNGDDGEVTASATKQQRQQPALPTLEEFADSFVDYEGGMGEENLGEVLGQEHESSRTQDTTKNVGAQKVFLRQEEEENTQDLLAELEQQQLQRPVPDAEEGWNFGAALPVPAPMDSQQQQSGDEEVANVINSLDVAPKSSGPIAETSQEEQQTRPQSHSQPSPAKRRSPSRSLDSSIMIPATISPTRPDQITLFPSQALPVSDGGNQHLEAAMNLLNKKSEEIARLESLLSSAQSQIQTLETEAASRESTAIGWQEERTKTLEEQATLRHSIHTLQGRLDFAEKNAEVFKDQYLRASAYTADIRATNAELQERAEVAESQANTGIASIRSMYEIRIKQLEDETTYHKRVAVFLMEQAQRTQDEDIRRRAAEHPELERKIGEMEEKFGEMEGLLDGARGMIDALEKQVTNSVVVAEHEHATTNGDGAPEEGEGKVDGEKVDGEIPVYRCLWRKNGTERCEAIFLTREALRHHLECDGHIQ
ncbi:hypothetical protein AN958_10037 [Leucoagaricus sp. SymC.cos]|nr:hypothetical protein AN958_10037 [Leucoagaricus sp. SymC.cos]